METSLKIGRYQVEQLLGSGAYADVYAASDTLLKRKVALKILKSRLLADEESFARFVQEAQTASGLTHPHIAWVWDLGEADGRYFIAMRYIEGMSLDKLIEERGCLPWDEAMVIMRQVAEALEYAHARGLVHRDVKPQNILISPIEGAVLTDFGLVRAVEASGSLTRTGALTGTPQYMAPEVWEGLGAAPAADQFSLACVLVEMLTGQGLFDAPTSPAIMKKIFAPLQLPAQWPAGVPDGFSDLLRRALAQAPEQRFADVNAFVHALESQPPEAPALLRREGERLFLRLEEDLEMEFCRIPAGGFRMGSDPRRDGQACANEQPQREVTTGEYWMARYPVTHRQYAAFTHSTGNKIPAGWVGRDYTQGLAEHPVTHLTWSDAAAFCAWLQQSTGVEARLPSEVEWEKAARGTDGRIYPWGDQPASAERCNFAAQPGAGRGATPVGTHSPVGDSPFGCADMAGNVWEWCADQFDTAPAGDRSSGERRVLRGGSWDSGARSVRAAFRYWSDPQAQDDCLGFRCAIELNEGER